MNARPAGTFAVLAFLSGCFSAGGSEPTFSGGRAPRTDAVLAQASTDLECPTASLRIVVETNRRFLNESAFRFVVEGCGERAGYVEQCELEREDLERGFRRVSDHLSCRNVLVTRVRIAAPPR